MSKTNLEKEKKDKKKKQTVLQSVAKSLLQKGGRLEEWQKEYEKA